MDYTQPPAIVIRATVTYDGGSTSAEAKLTVKRGVWPKPVYVCGDPKQAKLPAGQRVRVLQRVGAGWETFDGVAGSDGRVRVNGEIVNL
jgi:hypothetical protein